MILSARARRSRAPRAHSCQRGRVQTVQTRRRRDVRRDDDECHNHRPSARGARGIYALGALEKFIATARYPSWSDAVLRAARAAGGAFRTPFDACIRA
jgi:hypothetical protein